LAALLISGVVTVFAYSYIFGKEDLSYTDF